MKVTKHFLIAFLIFSMSQLSCSNSNTSNFTFDYCNSCITATDAIEYEKSINGQRIPALTDEEYFRIFEKKSFLNKKYATSYEETINDAIFINIDTLTGLKKITLYNYKNGYLADKFPPDKIFIDKIIIKYFQTDSALNTYYPSNSLRSYNFDSLKAFSEHIKEILDRSQGYKSKKYEPLNIKKQEDFNFKDEIYGYIWMSDLNSSITLELNFSLSYDMIYDSESLKVRQEDMAIYFEQSYYGQYLDSLRVKYIFPN